MKKKITFILILALALTVLTACGQKEDKKSEDQVKDELEKVEEKPEEKEKPEEEKEETVEIEGLEQLKKPLAGEEVGIIETNHGIIKVRLFDEVAPKAVENFKTHAKNGYYDGVSFHRIIEGFMIQGGDPDGTGMGGESIWGQGFEDEFSNDYRNIRGALSMANAGPKTNGSQFFIVQAKKVEVTEILDKMKELGEGEGFTAAVIEAYEKLGGAPWLDGTAPFMDGGHTVFGQVYEGMDVVDKIAELEVDKEGKPKDPVIMKKVHIEKYK